MKPRKWTDRQGGRRTRWDAERLRSLATLLGAGLAPVQALDVLQQQFPGSAIALGRMSQRLRGGESLARTLSQAQVLSPSTADILQVAENAGQLDEALRQVAASAERRRKRIRAFRVKLWLPWGVLIMALFAGSLLRMQMHDASLSGVSLDLGLWLGLVAVVTGLLLRLLETDTVQWLSWGWCLGARGRSCLAAFGAVRDATHGAAHGAAHGKKQRSRLYNLAYEYYFLALLLWPLKAGADCGSALASTARLLQCSDYQRAVRRAQHCVYRGETLADALQQTGLLLSTEMTQLIRSAEQAGRVAPAIEHQLALLQQRLELAAQTLYEWLPRFYYLLVLGVAGRFLAG
ncbi:type II secretion system F family protein [Marinobacterium rhizophilum]|uniref:type II secretion system F family protein n=1 Tax=Marinobacterium rhizophilum TaxID=420402 RepID=UPI000369C32B|nr:type II secretion system F family protein [Marinobacterium rhizophilum]